MNKKFLCSALAALLWSTSVHGDGEHGAHVHGVAVLNVVFEGTGLVIQLETPAANVVGFEYLPTTAEDKTAVADAAAALARGETLFSFDTEAGCHQATSEVESPMLAALAESGQDHEHEHEHGEAHSEFEVTWEFVCESPSALGGFRVNLFDTFPGFDAIEANLVTPNAQDRQELVAGSARISF